MLRPRKGLRPNFNPDDWEDPGPVLLGLLFHLGENGTTGLAWSFDDLEAPEPTRITYRLACEVILRELGQFKYDATTTARERREWARGSCSRTLGRRSRGTAARTSVRGTTKALRVPTSRSVGARDANVVYQREDRKATADEIESRLDYWARIAYRKYIQLREELGSAFLKGTPNDRERMMRVWVHRYRREGSGHRAADSGGLERTLRGLGIGPRRVLLRVCDLSSC